MAELLKTGYSTLVYPEVGGARRKQAVESGKWTVESRP